MNPYNKESSQIKLKIAKVILLFKSGQKCQLNNYRPISILPTFSKILEKIMYNPLYTLTQTLYNEQFGFQRNHSTGHAILQLINEICESSDNKYTLRVFIDLSKAFDTVNYQILLEKLNFYGINNIYHKWLSNYLTNLNQYIPYNDKQSIIRARSIMWCSTRIYTRSAFISNNVNNLYKASNILHPIMFADDANLFYSHNIKFLFNTITGELNKIHEWFTANKLSQNTSETKILTF